MRTFSHWRSVSVCLVLLGAVRCGAMSSQDEASLANEGTGGTSLGTGPGSANPATSDGVGLTTGGGGSAPVVAPEMEVEKAFEAPVATDQFVWSANPKTGRVALIDSKTFQVKTVAAGVAPTYIAAIPGVGDRAIVINVFSNDATYLSQADNGELEQRTYPLAVGAQANSWGVSPDGRWAIAWTDFSRFPNADPFDGFQTISIIDLNNPDVTKASVSQTVGFRPSSVSFADNPPRALVVAQKGINIIDLTKGADPDAVRKIDFPTPIAIPMDAGVAVDSGPRPDAATADGDAPDSDNVDPNVEPAIVPGKADVSITPKGDYAVLRREGSPFATIINLTDKTPQSWQLSGPITDIDLADTGDRAVAVVRNSSSAAILPIPGTGSAPSEITIVGETIGSVVIAPLGQTALLYTNALPISRLTVLHLDAKQGDKPYEVISLDAPVLSVFPSPAADFAVVIHNNMKGTLSKKPGAFSVVPLSGDRSPVIQTTDAPPMSVAISAKGDRALIPARDSQAQIYLAYLANLTTGVVVPYKIPSPPTAGGFVSKTGQAFIAQEHPAGRVTFIDPASGQVRTITGFELGASVIEWSAHDGGKP